MSCAPDFIFFNGKENRRFRMIFDIENGFESQNFAIFAARFIIRRSFAKDLLKLEIAYFYSIILGFNAEVAKKFLNVSNIYVMTE